MITLNIRLDELIDDLLKILDEDAEHIKLTLGRLNRLRAGLQPDRDNTAHDP